MTEKQPQWGVEITAWRLNATTICLDWRTMETGWVRVPAGKGQHKRVLVEVEGYSGVPELTMFCQRMANYIIGTRQYRVNMPRGMRYREVGGEAAPVPPSGGEGGESPDGSIPGQEPFPELDNTATIMTPATTDKPESVSEAKPRRRSSGSKTQVREFVPGHGVLTRQVH